MSTDFKSGASTDSATLAKKSLFPSRRVKCTIFVKRDFHLLVGQPAFLAAFGKFHFAQNNISIDCRVSGLIVVARQNFFVKGWSMIDHFKKPYRSIFYRNFFRPKMELKFVFGQGSAYLSTSLPNRSRHNSSTPMNWSTVSHSTTRSLPSLEYKKNLRDTGSTTQRVKTSSCISFLLTCIL